MKLALTQTKGGVGKTTLAVNIAVERARAGRKVLLIDADDQGTASDFTAARTETLGHPGYTAVKLSGASVRTQALQMAPDYQDIIIDVGGRDTPALRAALTVAEVALIPFQPRSFDIWVLETVAGLITESRVYNPDLRALALINFADPQGSDNASAAEVLAGADTITLLETTVGRRKAFPNAAAEGLGVGELKRQRHDAKALAEITALIAAIFPTEE